MKIEIKFEIKEEDWISTEEEKERMQKSLPKEIKITSSEHEDYLGCLKELCSALLGLHLYENYLFRSFKDSIFAHDKTYLLCIADILEMTIKQHNPYLFAEYILSTLPDTFDNEMIEKTLGILYDRGLILREEKVEILSEIKEKLEID